MQPSFPAPDCPESVDAERADGRPGAAAQFAQPTIDALSAHLCVLDQAGTILATNDAWCRFAEENPAAPQRAQVGDNYLQVCDSVTGADAPQTAAFAEGIRSVIQNARLDFTQEYTCHSPTQERWFVGRVTRFSSDGAIHIVVAHEDVTARKRSDMAAAHLAAIVQSSDDAIIGKDLNGTVTSWNQGAARLFGYTAAEIVGTSIMRLIPAGRQEEESHILGRIRRGETVSHFETLRQTKDGRLIEISVTASPIRDEAGQVIGVSKVAYDITDRKREEEARHTSEGRYRTWFDHAPDGILVANRESYYLDANPSMCRMLGYSRDELIGLHASDIVAPEECSQIESALHLIQTTAEYQRRWRFRRKDGSFFPAEVIATVTPDGNLLGMIRDITGQVQAEAALRRERDWAQRYLDTADVILLALDLQGRVTLVNRHACAVFGMSADALIGRDFIDTCVPPRIRQATRDKLRTVQAGDDAVIENPIITQAGEERLIEWRTTFLRDDAGQVTGTLSSGTDVTDKRRAELAVREERDRAQRYLDSAEVILLALDLEGRVTLINRKGCELLGRSESELLGCDWIETCLPARVQGTLTQKRVRLLSGDVSVIENPVVAAGGAERLIEWRNSVVRDEAGRVTGTFSSGTDVTERHAAVEALRTAEERMRFALQSAEVGIWDMDYTTGVLQWSEIVEAQYGLQPGTFAGTFEAFVERVHPDDREPLLASLMSAVASGADFSVQHRSVWPDGTLRWLTGAGRILLGKDGEPVRGVGISLDVTDRRKLEEQYQQAQKMEAIGRLAGGVAHDFNNLLTAILGYCELLLSARDSADPDFADISEIQTAGLRAAGLTRQLLAFSRKQIIEPTLLDLNVVVTEIRVMLERLIGEDVSIGLSLRPHLGLIRADRGQVEQIVMNLAVNARDAMPCGGFLTIETVSVELDEHYAKSHAQVTPGSYVVLMVTDTGIGMTPEVQARLFEPFFTTKEVGKGTGLGLATVHGIVMRTGGSVDVYSEVGKGTSFKVYFPMAAGTETAVEIASSSSPAGPGVETVLVVEDADGLRELAKRLLERQGYTVLLAADAAEALSIFDRTPGIHVLLTDVVMPGASGPELTKQLIERQPGLKVIYMSGYTEDAITHHGVLNPGIDFLHKPFTSETLSRKLREVLDR
jgi:two-component system, cell cycle sensor histidine kinase and response regulator CckA